MRFALTLLLAGCGTAPVEPLLVNCGASVARRTAAGCVSTSSRAVIGCTLDLVAGTACCHYDDGTHSNGCA